MHGPLRGCAIRLERHDARPQRAEMKKGSAGTRPPVEGERHRAGVGALDGIGDIEDLGGNLALGAIYRQSSGRRLVCELPAFERDRVLRYAVLGKLRGGPVCCRRRAMRFRLPLLCKRWR